MVDLLVSTEFLIDIMLKYNNYSKCDFDNSRDIDQMSFLFFNKIIKENKCHLILSISDENIFRIRKGENLSDDREKDLHHIFKGLNFNLIKGNPELYEGLKHQRLKDVDVDKLPCMVLLDKVDEQLCRQIEERYGIDCYSLKRMKIEDRFSEASPESVDDTKESLFRKLRERNYNMIEIRDQYFLKNSSAKEDCNKNKEFFGRLKKKGLDSLRLLLRVEAIIEKLSLEDVRRRIELLESAFKKYRTENLLNWKMDIEQNAKHDRYIFTNTTIVSISNSLNVNTSTVAHFYPRIIYSGVFDHVK